MIKILTGVRIQGGISYLRPTCLFLFLSLVAVTSSRLASQEPLPSAGATPLSPGTPQGKSPSDPVDREDLDALERRLAADLEKQQQVLQDRLREQVQESNKKPHQDLKNLEEHLLKQEKKITQNMRDMTFEMEHNQKRQDLLLQEMARTQKRLPLMFNILVILVLLLGIGLAFSLFRRSSHLEGLKKDLEHLQTREAINQNHLKEFEEILRQKGLL